VEAALAGHFCAVHGVAPRLAGGFFFWAPYGIARLGHNRARQSNEAEKAEDGNLAE
jgi:hypothetical protein